ncbi:MAG TPA: segregation/condensation protein A [Pirellulaceae bacterium]|jgi:segregation and condensation protein A|nr:segregation/condensation protein A [Pirellulaceae bacterium]
MSFRVDLATFRGPLDLLLYLVRKHEIDIADIPIALITEQFLEHLEVLELLDVDDVGDFVEMASTLLETKSRIVLPRVDEEVGEVEDPRDELVQRLLEYKKYKDAASLLEEQSRQWQCRFTRLADDLPPRRVDLGTQPIQEIELWDLVSAMGRIMRDGQRNLPSNIVYDDTPIHVYMERIHAYLIARGEAKMSDLLQLGMHKTAMIGVFLAILELTRHHGVRTEQQHLHGEILILPSENFRPEADFSNVDNYGTKTTQANNEEATAEETEPTGNSN